MDSKSCAQGLKTPLILLGLTLGFQSHAADILPGGSAIVNAGDPATFWTVTGGGLVVNPGGQTLGLRGVAGGTLALDGATVTGVNPAAQLNAPGISLQSGTATITNSTVSSVNDIGLSSDKVGLADPGSTATVSGSTISGIGRGVSVGGGSSVSLTDTQVTSTGSGAGGVIADGVASLFREEPLPFRGAALRAVRAGPYWSPAEARFWRHR